MNVEFTGRQYDITPAIRQQVKHGLEKLEKIFGSDFDTHVVLATEKHRNIAEITVTVKKRPMVGVAEAAEMSAAVGEALDRIDKQAVKYKTRQRARKRQSRRKWPAEQAAAAATSISIGVSESTAVPVVVHGFPAIVKVAEAHVTRADDAVALRPLSLEEAIKEAEFRDRDVFVFRDPQGKVKILHRRKDGKMELIEAP